MAAQSTLRSSPLQDTALADLPLNARIDLAYNQ
jgi:hypothetical protein